MIQPDSGPPNTTESGMPIMNQDTALARSLARKPLAEVVDDARQEARFGDAEQEAHDVEAPARRCTNIMPAEMSPQVIMMRAIHRRAPKRTSSRLLGISNSA